MEVRKKAVGRDLRTESASEGPKGRAVETDLPDLILEADYYLFRGTIEGMKDGLVKIWKVREGGDKKMVLDLKECKNFEGPVYKASFNFLGHVIAVSFCNEQEEKV